MDSDSLVYVLAIMQGMSSKNTAIALLIGLIIFALYIFRIDEALIFHSDFARDLYEILKVAQGNLTLLGPKLSFGGLYAGPYYFYLFVPVFILTGISILSIPIFNAFLFACSLAYFAKKTIDKHSLTKGIFATICLSSVTLTVFAARSPGNATSYLPLLLILLTYIHFERIDSRLKLIVLGLTFGIIVNFTLAALVLFLPLTFLLAAKLTSKSGNKKSYKNNFSFFKCYCAS